MAHAGILHQIIDEYLAGGRRIGDVSSWVGSEMES